MAGSHTTSPAIHNRLTDFSRLVILSTPPDSPPTYILRSLLAILHNRWRTRLWHVHNAETGGLNELSENWDEQVLRIGETN